VSRRQYEYYAEDLRGYGGVPGLQQHRLSVAGLGGWKLVAVCDGVAYFRREARGAPPAGLGRRPGEWARVLAPVIFALGLLSAVAWIWRLQP
jgi:hypothetical protein